MDGVRVRRAAAAALALVLLLQAGCALAVIGVAAGGAAAGYTYLKGALVRDYPSGRDATMTAAKAGLTDLGFPIIDSKVDTGTGWISSKTADGHKVVMYFDVIASPVPAEGAMTRVTVRVGYAGDDVVSAKILDALQKHVPPSAGLPPALPPGPPVAVAPPPNATPEPPIAPVIGTATPIPIKR